MVRKTPYFSKEKKTLLKPERIMPGLVMPLTYETRQQWTKKNCGKYTPYRRKGKVGRSENS
jgi:hypothetical protein